MTRAAAVTVAVAVLLVSGVAHGLYAERWSESPALLAAAARVPDVPRVLGDWKARDLPEDAESFEQTGAISHWTRAYTHRRSGATVTVTLMCGRARRMAVHTPEVCYRGAGYEMADAATRFVVRNELGEAQGELWTAEFARPGGGDLRLYWSWNSGGHWQAPDSPRWHYRGEPLLYKLYVSGDRAAPGSAGDHAGALLRELLPALDRALFPGANQWSVVGGAAPGASNSQRNETR